MQMENVCPMCHALVLWEFSETEPIVCEFCKNVLKTGFSDPTGHWLREIDPDIGGGAFGACHIDLIPPGTEMCVKCRNVYPKAFECCPRLVDLALAEYGQSGSDHGPRTQERIVEFLTSRPIVVENTIKLRLMEAEFEEPDTELGKIAAQIRFCVTSIGLPYDVAKYFDEEDE